MPSFVSRHALPVLVLGVAGACGLFLGLILHLVASQNAVADTERRHRAVAVLSDVAAILRRDVTVTANWDAAYLHLGARPDERWFWRHVSALREESRHRGIAAVVDASGRLIFGVQNGLPVEAGTIEALMEGLRPSLYAAARSPGRAAGTFVDVSGLPAYAAVARICAHATPGRCTERFLVRATGLETLIRDAAIASGWRNLRVERDTPTGSSLPIPGADGALIANLVWDAATPGSDALRASAPWTLGALALIGLCVLGLSRRVRRATAALDRASAEALRLAGTDALTGVMNRRAMQDCAERHVAAGTRFHMVSLDLDGFKEINDTLGAETGDLLLIEMARRLLRMAPEGGVIARLGGDEFAALLPGDDDAGALEFARDLVLTLNQPFAITGQSISVSASIGVASCRQAARPEEVLRRADVALYAAKAAGGGGAQAYRPMLDETPRLVRGLDREMRAGFAQGQFHVVYQPIFSVATGGFGGVEALLRWTHPERGPISPATFIPAAEKLRFVLDLGDFVLREACGRLADRPDLSLSVNLSPVQLLDDRIAERVRRILAETGMDPARLEFEVTEGYLVSQEDRALRTLRRLRDDLGVRISLDDFGSGYASIGFLRRFPLDKIKVDQSFVRPVETDPLARRMFLSMVGLSQALQIPITAEGVETEAQAAFVRAAGCDHLQGYLFARPAATLPERNADWGVGAATPV